MNDLAIFEKTPVSLEEHHAIEQFLYKEARMLDNELLREWISNVVDPEISYQMVVYEERFRKDRSPDHVKEVMAFEDNFPALDMRIRQFESGLQTMNNPRQRMRRVVENVQAFQNETADEYTVLSYGVAFRFRRLYENEQVVFGREDVIRKDSEGNFRLLKRRIDLDERVIRNKNLLFFL